MAMRVSNYTQEALDIIRSVELHQIVDAAIIGGEIAVGCFAVRTLAVAISRATGIYSPDQYRHYPRIIPWRWPYLKIYLPVVKWFERYARMGKRPTGGFAGSLSVFAKMYKPGMLFMGRAYAKGLPFLMPYGTRIERHGFLFSMTGGGKTTLLISQISTWRGSCFVIDPKGQITYALSGHDTRTWIIFCPQKKFGYDSASFNVFDLLDELYQTGDIGAFVDWIHYIALVLIPTPEGVRTPYFYETPCGFIVGLIIHVYTYHPKECWNLPFIRDLIKYGYRVFNQETGGEETTAEEAFALLLRAMRNNNAIDNIIPGAAAAFASASNETLANLKSTLLTQTKWLDNPSIRDVLKTSSFDPRDLKRREDVVFTFVSGVLALKGYLAPLANFIISVTALAFEHFEEKNGQCLMVIDEMPSIGHISVIESILPVLRSYGISFVGISQDIPLIKQAYPKTWCSFIGNADFVIWMATNEDETKQYISNTLGKTTIKKRDELNGRKKNRNC